MAQQFVIEGSTAGILVTVLSERDNVEKKGWFKFQCLLDAMDLINQDAVYRDLIGARPHEGDKFAVKLAWSLAQLKYRVIEAPDWWKEGNKEIWGTKCDFNIIKEILDVAIEAEELFLSDLANRAKKAKDAIGEDIDNGKIVKKLGVEGEE